MLEGEICHEMKIIENAFNFKIYMSKDDHMITYLYYIVRTKNTMYLLQSKPS